MSTAWYSVVDSLQGSVPGTSGVSRSTEWFPWSATCSDHLST